VAIATVSLRDQKGENLCQALTNIRRSLQEADRAYILEVGRVTPSGTAGELEEEEQVKKAYLGV
jgi:ABC-type branched-subunit amino acid transport system ATPase component